MTRILTLILTLFVFTSPSFAESILQRLEREAQEERMELVKDFVARAYADDTADRQQRLISHIQGCARTYGPDAGVSFKHFVVFCSMAANKEVK
ncbi:MAG: hypothetical protein RIC14_05560 [Filomicrobium sp.]